MTFYIRLVVDVVVVVVVLVIVVVAGGVSMANCESRMPLTANGCHCSFGAMRLSGAHSHSSKRFASCKQSKAKNRDTILDRLENRTTLRHIIAHLQTTTTTTTAECYVGKGSLVHCIDKARRSWLEGRGLASGAWPSCGSSAQVGSKQFRFLEIT